MDDINAVMLERKRKSVIQNFAPKTPDFIFTNYTHQYLEKLEVDLERLNARVT